MAQQQQTRASPDTGLIITEEMIIARFRRTLLVFGHDRAVDLYDHYDDIFRGFPGWETTRLKLEDILLNDEKDIKASYVQGELPPVLCTDEAMALWGKAIREGYVDDHFQPLLSRTQSALMANVMANKLNLKDKWKPFEVFWNRSNMRSDYSHAGTQQQYPSERKKFERAFDR